MRAGDIAIVLSADSVLIWPLTSGPRRQFSHCPIATVAAYCAVITGVSNTGAVRRKRRKPHSRAFENSGGGAYCVSNARRNLIPAPDWRRQAFAALPMVVKLLKKQAEEISATL
jgi:hypothetical protein